VAWRTVGKIRELGITTGVGVLLLTDWLRAEGTGRIILLELVMKTCEMVRDAVEIYGC